MGFVLPENFNQPFFKPNIQQLWANFPYFLDQLAHRLCLLAVIQEIEDIDYFRRNRILLSNCAIIVTFVIGHVAWRYDDLLLWGRAVPIESDCLFLMYIKNGSAKCGILSCAKAIFHIKA